MDTWFIELAKGIGRVFLNPLLYWALILVIFAGYKRIKRERKNFGVKVFDVFAEWKSTWGLSLISGFVISVITLGAGLVLTYETILLLSAVIIILSLTLNFTMLSSSYTIGISFILLLFLPFLLENQTYVDPDLFSATNFTGLILLLGIFLIVEAFLLGRVKDNESFPELRMGNRGAWTGQHHARKMAFIPFLILVPTGMITPFAAYWPYFSIGEETYSLVLVPFLLGFDHVIKSNLPRQSALRIAKRTAILGTLVILMAIGGSFLPWLSFAAVLIAIIGKEYINYNHRAGDRKRTNYYHQTEKGLKVLAVIPGTPADRLGIRVGETIYRVNGKKVGSTEEFYQALQESGASFKLDLLDHSDEIRFVQGALYEGEHHELGIIFTSEPYRLDKKRSQKAAAQN
ncbi:PDZ domain-containing protein [Virgibacillus indicus]|nr:PDZ domain-containing protein [Virgibacillus indicus]